ncbi:MAG: hypothetical protein M3459_03705 [Actinomycetota bacterium]|nr:hypothetical protein [Actinomycetota bacterium]
MEHLEHALAEAGGTTSPPACAGRLRRLLLEELDRGREELARPRSGYAMPVGVAVASCAEALVGVAPVSPGMRVDPDAASERGWRVGTALAGALCDAAALPAPSAADDLVMLFGEFEAHLVLAVPVRHGDAELAVVAYEEATARIDRLRTRAFALPGHVLDGVHGALAPPIGDQHPLRVAEAVARLGGRPADPASVEIHEEAVLALIGGDGHGPTRPHDDPDPARRVARRILQRLHGMGKWGGYHTEFSHLARGFQGNDRALAEAVGEALLEEGLLSEKRSVGQRHVFLNPRRAGEIHTLIDTGATPKSLALP